MTMMPKRFAATRLLAAMAVAGLLSACGARGAEEGFPDPDRATPRGGTFVNLDNLRQTAPGMSKDQLYPLLGAPHFGEGMWGVREWNYLFNFRRGREGDTLACQLRIRFDGDVARQYDWRPESCRSLLDPPAPPAPPPPAPAPLPEQPLRLSADALFDFDSAELTAQGRAAVDALVRQVRSASEVQDILVVGHADRIGDADYNRTLSLRRADAVRRHLVAGGVPAHAISAEGRGQSQPVADCPGLSGRALIDCLAPDRRVEISGTARR